jgi:hypothetical protein
MVDGSSGGTQLNGTILAHQMPLADAVHHITVTHVINRNFNHRIFGEGKGVQGAAPRLRAAMLVK